MTEESGFYSQQGRDIPLFSIVRSALGPPSLMSKWKKVFFPLGFSGRSMNLPTHIHVFPRVRTHESTPPFVHTPWQCDAEADRKKCYLILSVLWQRKIHNQELHMLYSSPYKYYQIKNNGIGGKQHAQAKDLVWKTWGKETIVYINREGRIILKWVSREQNFRTWTMFHLLKIESCAKSL